MSITYKYFPTSPHKDWKEILSEVVKFVNEVDENNLITINSFGTEYGKDVIVWYRTKQTIPPVVENEIPHT